MNDSPTFVAPKTVEDIRPHERRYGDLSIIPLARPFSIDGRICLSNLVLVMSPENAADRANEYLQSQGWPPGQIDRHSPGVSALVLPERTWFACDDLESLLEEIAHHVQEAIA